jgi:hypothetical protein
MHEMGHSMMDFRHSGSGENEYGDKTGYMGYSTMRQGYPRKAFNAHKHWISGWFDDSAMADIDLGQGESHATGKLLSFVDYQQQDQVATSPRAPVILRVGNLYIQYNAAKGYNIDEDESVRSRVTIVEAVDSDSISDLKAILGQGEVYVHQTGDGNGLPLVIEVCGLGIEGSADLATLSIRLDSSLSTATTNPCNNMDDNDFGRSDTKLQDAVTATKFEPISTKANVKSASPAETGVPLLSFTSSSTKAISFMWVFPALLGTTFICPY